MIDKLRDTTWSHDRRSVVEVTGRNAGYIAWNAAIELRALWLSHAEKELTCSVIF